MEGAHTKTDADAIMTYRCLDCQRGLSEDEVTRCSLDAYADLSVDYDLICNHCGNNDVVPDHDGQGQQ